MVACRERLHFSFDAEQLRDEVFEMGRQRDEQIGFLLAGRRIAPRLEKLLSERRLEKIAERRVEAQQAIAIVEIGEREAVGEAQFAGSGAQTEKPSSRNEELYRRRRVLQLAQIGEREDAALMAVAEAQVHGVRPVGNHLQQPGTLGRLDLPPAT